MARIGTKQVCIVLGVCYSKERFTAETQSTQRKAVVKDKEKEVKRKI
tara:strand:- start:247 stop:387 length:141 start_codon:yes stop_codon:yes gene_type:complete